MVTVGLQRNPDDDLEQTRVVMTDYRITCCPVASKRPVPASPQSVGQAPFATAEGAGKPGWSSRKPQTLSAAVKAGHDAFGALSAF
jgi:hypothetical protein